MKSNSKGVQFNDRVKAGQVRSKVLDIADKILQDETHPLYKETYLSLVKNVLPRLNEVTGEAGEPLDIIIKLRDAKDSIVPSTTV